MKKTLQGNYWLVLAMLAWTATAESAEPEFRLQSTVVNGRVEATQDGKQLLVWQAESIKNPVGGESFAGSAFFHPLQTPSGFCWTLIQPDDHKHHFGLWWPWKYIEVEGKTYNTWEIQEEQGGHIAADTKTLSCGTDGAEWEFQNQTVIKQPGNKPEVVIRENTRAKLSLTKDMQVLDLMIHQRAAGPPVTVLAYRYSGFSWRGPASWNKDNSVMITDSAKNRDNANGSPSHWVMVCGPTPHGSATVLMMSAANSPEKLRVWDSKTFSGTPFVNFNPVMDRPLPLDGAHPEVSLRRYRVIAADRALTPVEANAEWKSWVEKIAR